MPSRRIVKVNRAILETLSSTILFELRDPRVKNVTILNVETTDDLKAAKVRVGVRGDAKTQSLSLHGLESARGFLQAKIADRLETRYTPILKFVLEPNWLDHLQETSAGFHEADTTKINLDSDDDRDDADFDTDDLSDAEGSAEHADSHEELTHPETDRDVAHGPRDQDQSL